MSAGLAPSPEEFEAAARSDGVEVVGQVVDASNAVFFCRVGPFPAVYKPIRGERPLWDFPDGHLAHRERAAFLLDAAGGFGVVPPTVLADGPFGPGSVQWWVTDPDESAGHPGGGDEGDERGPADDADRNAPGDDGVDDAGTGLDTGSDLFVLLPPGAPLDGLLPVLTGELPDGTEVVLAHADTPELRTVSVFDAVIDNSDRKGSHLLRGLDGHLWGIDHGVSLHVQPKLRTVLWGWAGRAVPEEDLARVRRIGEALADGPLRGRLEPLLTEGELAALTGRVGRILTSGTHPTPPPGWPAVPWPAL